MKKIGLLVMCCLFFSAKAQTENNDTDTLNCPIISFNFAPWVAHGAMNEMFSQPMLDFGVTAIYKTKNNFIFGIEGSFFFGDDNLKNRKERLQSLYTEAGTIIGTGGTDAGVEAYNRGLVGMVQVGKVIPVIKNNPNSGIFLMFGVGIAQNQIIYTPWLEEAPQLSDEYVKLYDHQQRGALVSERVGFWYMNDKKNYLNFHIAFEFTQMWLKSTRGYVIDDYMGIRGKDNNKYFSHIYGLKIGWMIPLEGKTTQEYYYY